MIPFRTRKIGIIFLFIFILENIVVVCGINTSKLGESGTITYVVDGDTMDVEGVGRIRLADINTPETDTKAGQEAETYVYNLCNQKMAYLDIDNKYETDKYGRYVAVVYIPYNTSHIMNLNQYLLKQGIAEIADYDNEFSPYTWRDSPMEYIRISGSDTTSTTTTTSSTTSTNDIWGILLIIAVIGFALFFVFFQALRMGLIPDLNTQKNAKPSPLFSVPNQMRSDTEEVPSSTDHLHSSNDSSQFGLAKADIVNLLHWSNWQSVHTRNGLREVRHAFPSGAFWNQWRTHKDQIKALGFSVGKADNKWRVNQWRIPMGF